MQKERPPVYTMTGPDVMYSGEGSIYNYDISRKNEWFIGSYFEAPVVNRFLGTIRRKAQFKEVERTFLGKTAKTKLLDLGSGEGYESSAFVRVLPYTDILSMDMSHEGCIRAKQKEGLKPVVADAHLPPFADETFDAIHCKDIMVHLDDKEILLQSIHRILKKHGHFLLVSSVEVFPKFGQIPWSPKDFTEVAQENGLFLIQQRIGKLKIDDWYRNINPKRAFMLFEKA